MYQIFLDESGELGIGRGSSKFFVLAHIITEEPSQRIKHIVRDVKTKYGIPKMAELKASTSRNDIRQAFLRRSLAIAYKTRALILNKGKAHEYLKRDKNVLYNFLAKELLLNYLRTFKGKTEIVFDKRTVRVTSGRMIHEYLQAELYYGMKYLENEITVRHEESKTCYFLQLADFVSNAIYRKHERGDYSLYNVIKDKLEEEITYRF